MILSQYIQNHFIQTINNIEINNQLIEINYYGEVINNFNYSNDNNIQFYKANNINIYNYWYFIQGPCNLYMTLYLSFYNRPICFLYRLYLLEHIKNTNHYADMWISNNDYSLYDIYEYNKIDNYIHNRLFSFFLSQNENERIFYNKCHENFIVLVQQLNCALQLYINQNQFNINYSYNILEQSNITKGSNLIGKLININTNRIINIYENKLIRHWKNINTFLGYYQQENNIYYIYINNILYICKFINNDIYFICEIDNINYFQLINWQLNFSILSGKINTKEYEYIWKNIYIIYNILIQYKKENKKW